MSFLQSHVAGLQMKLDLVPDFDYASAWFDPGKISPVIDRFVLSAIECSLPETHLSMQVSLKGDYWAIRIKDTGNKRFLKCCRWYSSRLPILRPLHGKQYGMGGVFFDKLMNICDGKILTLEKEALLRFPIRCSCAICDFMGNLKLLIKLHPEYWFDYCSSAYYCSSVIAEWIWCRNRGCERLNFVMVGCIIRK